MAILWAIKHFRQYVTGRLFILVTNCSGLTWLFRSRDLDPKLHRWALSLQEYDIDLRWRAGSANLVPDCLSRLPHPVQQYFPVDDSFRDSTSSAAPKTSSKQSDPVLDSVTLQELNLFDEPTVKPKEPLEAAAAEETTAIACALRELPFATCASLDDEQAPVSRFGRKQQPSVLLHDSEYPNIHRIKPGGGVADHLPRRWTPVPVDAPPRDP